MLSDRPYMREGYQREKTSFLVWLVSALVAVFVVQLVFSSLIETSGFEQLAALSPSAIRDGRLWTFVTYPLLHRGPLHLIAIVLALFFVGRELAGQVRERRLFWLAIAAALVGGLAWFGFHFNGAGDLIGASTVLWCYFTVFACLFPNREISFLVFFVIPITTRPKYIAWLLVVIDLVGLALTELQPEKFPRYQVPHSAHLGAMLVGWLYYRYIHDATWLVLRPSSAMHLERAKGRPRKAPPIEVDVEPAAAKREDIRAELDRILDKINSHGLSSLTPEEKRMLDDAKSLLSRR